MEILNRRLASLSPIYLLSFLVLVLGGSTAWYVQHLYQELPDILDHNVASVRAAEELEIGLREIRTRLSDYIFRESSQDIAALPALRAETDKWLKETNNLATTPLELRLIAQINRGYDHFFQALDHAPSPMDQETKRKLRTLIDSILTKEIIAPAHEYLDYNEQTMTAVANEHRVFSARFALAMLALGICGSAGGFFAGLSASRRMKRTMVELNLPITAAVGKLSEVVGPVRLATSLDLDELKQVLKAISLEVEKVVMRLQTSQQEVLLSEKLAAIGQLAAGTAHEIRNPLMSIKLLIQASLAAQTSDLSQDDLKLIENEISRVERTVQNLLDFSRPRHISRKNVSIKTLAKHCVALVSGRASIQDVKIYEQIPEDDFFVEGDDQQLEQVILNMLMNSLDSTRHSDSITVAAERKMDAHSAKNCVRVWVSDTGAGIPEAILPLAFEPFVSGKESGTGLGLSISKQIIEAHSGQVFAKNNETGGAIVGFLLPAMSAPL